MSSLHVAELKARPPPINNTHELHVKVRRGDIRVLLPPSPHERLPKIRVPSSDDKDLAIRVKSESLSVALRVESAQLLAAVKRAARDLSGPTSALLFVVHFIST